MPDHPKPNVFAPEFLEQAFEREPPPLTGPEATWAGPWKVEPQCGSLYVVRESGGEPVVVTEHRETALCVFRRQPTTHSDFLRPAFRQCRPPPSAPAIVWRCSGESRLPFGA